MTDPAVRRAARLGHPFVAAGLQSFDRLRDQIALWREEMARHGRAPCLDLPVLREFYAAPDHEQAVREAAGYVETKYRAYAEHGFAGAAAELRDLDCLRRAAFIVGGPEECVERLAAYGTLGVTHVALRLLWPGMEQRAVLEMIELTGSKIIPGLRQRPGG